MVTNKNVIYLIGCSINAKSVDNNIVKKMDLDRIYEVCCLQRISACLYPALKNISGINIKP